MKPDDVQPGDSVKLGHPVTVSRYNAGGPHQPLDHRHQPRAAGDLRPVAVHAQAVLPDRPLRGRSGHPRIHPWIGVVLFVSFSILFIRFWRANL